MSNKPMKFHLEINKVLKPETKGWLKLATIPEGSLWRVWTEFNRETQKEEMIMVEYKNESNS